MKNDEEKLLKELEKKKLELQESLIKEKEELVPKSLDSKGKKCLKKID
ncbi:MAG: hypothetical protein HWN81_20035 [Candidatus Lokiarchaeota archaeon]|nr:hypothetical protein [Candidatus Lokiarchaeota archaeon]